MWVEEIQKMRTEYKRKKNSYFKIKKLAILQNIKSLAIPYQKKTSIRFLIIILLYFHI